MKKPYVTEFKAIDPKDGELKSWGGPVVWGSSWKKAQRWCHDNQGHLLVIGELYMEVPADKHLNPDWDKAIDYEMCHKKGEHKSDQNEEI